MIPLHLTISGFLSYRDPVELDFTSFDLACISGSNGAGKSSLLDAMTWVLFGQARKRDDSLINAHSQAMEVTLEFAYEGNVYRVQRSKAREKPAFILFSIRQGDDEQAVWRPITENSLRETEKRIEDTLRMDYETFTNAAFFLQGKADQFSQQRPADRKRVLSSILGLEVWETYREQAAEQRRALEKECDSIEGQLREIQVELGEEPARRTRLAALQADLQTQEQLRLAQESVLESMKRDVERLAQQRANVEKHRQSLLAAQKSIQEQQERLDASRQERQEKAHLLENAAQIKAAYQAWQDARQELVRWDEIATRFNEQDRQRQEPLLAIEKERARLTAEADGLKARKREVDQSQLEKQRTEDQVHAFETALGEVNRRLERAGEAEIGLRELHQQQAEAKAENPRLRTEMDELKARIEQLQHSSGGVCPTCGKPLEAGERDALITGLSAQGKNLGDRYRQNLALLKDFENRVRAAEDEIKTLKSADGEARQLNRQIDQLRDRAAQAERQAQAWTADGEPHLAEIERRLAQDEFAPEAHARLVVINAELRAMGYDAAAHDAARRAELEGRSLERELRELEKAESALAPLDREIANMQAQLGALEETVGNQQAEYDQALQSLQAMEAQAPDVERAERELFDTRSKENALRMAVGSANQSVAVLDALRGRSTKLTARRDDLNRQIGHYKTLERSFSKDGVPALLIEQALPEIETEANEILDRLSAGSMSVSFATQREYKDRKRDDLRETLDILIQDGSGMRDYEMFSGGEAFRVNFAIRLALSKVLAQRAGARLQTLVIDEGFGSQDEQGRQRLIEAINLVRPDFAKILVITHMEELKDAFPTRIEVEKTARGSTVKVV